MKSATHNRVLLSRSPVGLGMGQAIRRLSTLRVSSGMAPADPSTIMALTFTTAPTAALARRLRAKETPCCLLRVRTPTRC